ncbi:hypothetical protein BDZ45DRAFT_24270 [Acephala macrosclerotiorum]|nr:hypothetical protein BDZ45DRAFT_24270 [Acephala macrosclerotiorum]
MINTLTLQIVQIFSFLFGFTSSAWSAGKFPAITSLFKVTYDVAPFNKISPRRFSSFCSYPPTPQQKLWLYLHLGLQCRFCRK